MAGEKLNPTQRIAIITGAAKGLGLACARRFAAEGYALVLVGTNIETLDAAAGSLGDAVEVTTTVADIRHRDQCAAAVAHAVDRFGRADVLVNSAGVYPRRPVLDISADDWAFVWNTNVLGSYFMMIEAIADMRQHQHGRIVNITSIDGFKAHPANAHYAASKAAVISLTRSIALEVAPLGILVNSVAPGPMATDVAKAMDWYQPMVDALPTKTPIEPDEVARMVSFLAAADNVSTTGENVIVSGGGVIA